MERLVQDLRFGARMLIKQPAITAVAVLSLGLGIGANTTIFTVVNAVFLATIPVEAPERLARVYTIDWENPTALTGVAFPNYEDIRDYNTVFSGLADYAQTTLNLIPVNGEPRQIAAQLVTGNYFDVLGVRAFMGRTFLPNEDEEPTAVVVLSYGIWEREFGGDPEIIGREINLSRRPYTVVGIAPAGFKGLQTVGDPDLLWMPLSMRRLVFSGLQAQYFDLRRARFSQVIGRLKDGVTIEQADAEIRMIGARLEEEYPNDNRGRQTTVRIYSPVNPNQQAQYARAGGLMMAVVGVVLLIACANVANLLLARAADREKEIAIRVSLGAERGRLVRQLLTESVLLSLLAGTVGLLLALWGREGLWAYRPPSFGEQTVDLRFDWHVLAYTFGVTVITAILFGLVPALQASNPNLKETLQEGGRRSSSGTNRAILRKALVVAEVALALVALIGAGLFIRSMRNAQAIDPGFEAQRLLLMRINIGNAGYGKEDGLTFFDELMERLANVPGVEGVSISSGRLLGGGLPHTTFPEGVDIANGRGLHVQDIVVTPSYFNTIGIALREGRNLTDFDREGTTRVAVVNEATRRLFWPDTDPVGRRFSRTVENFPIEVVGVVDDALIDLGEPAQPIIYTAMRQFYQPAVQVQVRTASDPNTVRREVQLAMREVDPNLPILDLTTIGENMHSALWAPRVGSVLLGFFGVLALVLAVIGIYGVMVYSVSQRHHEIGLRMALGARQAHVLKLVVQQGMSLVMGGVVLGIVLAMVTTRLVQTMLWDVSATDPITFGVVSLLLLIVALLATLLPAMRVTRVDPLIAIRDEY